MTAHTKISGTWKDVASLQTKVAGSWKEVSEGYLKASGTWEQFFAPAALGSFDLLDEEILLSATGTVTFSSLDTLAAGYQHLQIRGAARTNVAGDDLDELIFRFNADTGSNYATHHLQGEGSSVTSAASTSQTRINRILTTGGLAGANIYSAFVIDVLDPFESSKNTTVRTFNGTVVPNRVKIASGVWLDTDAITEMSFAPSLGSTFNIGSRFSLYGIKAA